MVEFGKWLEQTRRQRGLKQKQIAALSGLSPSYISQLERGEPHSITDYRRLPSREAVIAIAKAVGVSTGEALDAAGYRPANGESNAVELDTGNATRFILLDGKGLSAEEQIEIRQMIAVAAELALRTVREKRK